MTHDLATAYLRWELLRAALARGYWVVTALYLVVVADLTPSQLVLIGAFQGGTVLLAEIPAGVLADAVSRRLSLVIGHVVTGVGMVMAGSVTAFPLLVISQCLWGVGWSFQSGADVAWLTDELEEIGEAEAVDRVLVAKARWDLMGRTIGIVVFAAMAWATSLATTIVVTGISMALLGILVVARWPESGFVAVDAGGRWREAGSILRRGLKLARADPVILVLLAATLLVEGSLETYGRLFENRLVALGMPTQPDPIVWFGAVSLVGFILGAVVLGIVESRIARIDVAKRTYVLSCAVAVVGLLLFAHAPDTASAVVGSLLVGGIARPIVRATAAIWVNRRTPSAVRATVQSILSQVISISAVVVVLALALVAAISSTTTALMGAAGLVACAGILVSARSGR